MASKKGDNAHSALEATFNGAPHSGKLNLDEFDLRLLELLQVNNRMTSEELSAAVHLSPTSCSRRIQRMRAAGAIEADVSIVSPVAQGPSMTIFVIISLVREDAHSLDKFAQKFDAEPACLQCHCIAGEGDVLLALQVENMESYRVFVERHFEADPNVRKIQTMISIRPFKSTTYKQLRKI